MTFADEIIQQCGSSPERQQQWLDINGITEFCQRLDISPINIGVLYFAYLCEADIMGLFTREQLTLGLERLGTGDWKSLKSAVHEYETPTKDIDKPFYLWIHTFAREPGMKTIPIELAVDYWKLIWG